MNSVFLSKTKRKSGFTLIELVIVIAVVVILIALLMPSMNGWIEEAKEARAITTCRHCVTAAATLAAKDYASNKNNYNVSDVIPPSSEEVSQRAGLGNNGQVLAVYLRRVPHPTEAGKEVNSAEVTKLMYRDADGLVVTYRSDQDPQYVFGYGDAWNQGQSYKVGDIMNFNGFTFVCLREHTSGTTSRTRNPALRSNKSTWEVIGYTDGKIIPYSSTVRYAEGLRTIYKGKTYIRTKFNLVGGQVPYENRSSDYWLLVN